MLVDICKKCNTKLAISDGLCNTCLPDALPKLSEQMREEAQKEENDLSYMGKMKKVFRQERAEKFEDVLPQLLKSVKVIDITHYEAQGKYMITTDTKFGIVDYYPKANKILIRKDNEWVLGGMNWLYKNLIN